MEVILRPLKKNTWAGTERFKNCFDYIGPYYTRSGQIYTGLTREDEARLEEKIRENLAPNSDFWAYKFYIKMQGKDLVLNTDEPLDELKYLFLKNHKRVADGLNNVKPTANYVLINKESEAKEINKYNKDRRKAMKEFDKLSLAEMRKCLRIYGYRSDSLSAELIEEKLFELVEKDPIKFFDRWLENKKRETEYLVQEAIAKNIVRRNKSEYKYGTDVIGHSMDDCIAYLDTPENRDLKQTIINDTNVK